MRKFLSFLPLLVLALGTAGCGGGDHESHGSTSDAKAPSRTIDITMKEFSYAPADVSVKAGETVKFVFHNEGQILHDAFIGDEAAQADHEKEMRENSGKMHDEKHAIKVLPGKTGELTHTFDKAGEALIIGCHETGHYGAGMKMAVTVS